MAKIERKYLAHFINASMPGEDAVYVRLGTDLEEYSPEMAAQVDTKKNILGETSILISSYEKTASVEPYYAEKGAALMIVKKGGERDEVPFPVRITGEITVAECSQRNAHFVLEFPQDVRRSFHDEIFLFIIG